MRSGSGTCYGVLSCYIGTDSIIIAVALLLSMSRFFQRLARGGSPLSTETGGPTLAGTDAPMFSIVDSKHTDWPLGALNNDECAAIVGKHFFFSLGYVFFSWWIPYMTS